MERDIYAQLLAWKDMPERKPLMLYGARQVGKTYILRTLGERAFERLAYVNCFRNAAVRTLFGADINVRRIVEGLSVLVGQPIEPGRTLLVLDEVQEVPAAVSALKYFCEELPRLHVAVAGSLLGVLNMQGESFPVGKVNILRMGPMTFGEFLRAHGEGRLAALVAAHEWPLVEAFHQQLTDRLRQYYYVGGMPEAVAHFIAHHDPMAVRRIQEDILAAYEVDIAKHTGAQTQRVRQVWQSIPAQLGKENKKFIYGVIAKGARAKDYELAIQWLVDAGLVHKVVRARQPRTPLRYYADPSAFKLYLLDVGLLAALNDAPAQMMLAGNRAMTEYKGALTENFVLQQLRSQPGMAVCYFSKDGSTQEVDFLLQRPDGVLPIEVKAEENVRAKSLAAFVNDHLRSEAPPLKAVRLSMRPYCRQEWMDNLPLYAAAACADVARE